MKLAEYIDGREWATRLGDVPARISGVTENKVSDGISTRATHDSESSLKWYHSIFEH